MGVVCTFSDATTEVLGLWNCAWGLFALRMHGRRFSGLLPPPSSPMPAYLRVAHGSEGMAHMQLDGGLQPSCAAALPQTPLPAVRSIDCEIGQCNDPRVNDTTLGWPSEDDFIVDLDSAVVTNMGAFTSKAESWRLCAVYVQLANGQRTSGDLNGDW